MPDFHLEDSYQNQTNKGLNHLTIAGIDEAGRGPLAGPVVAASVIVDRNIIFKKVNDSKKLSKLLREELYNEITTHYQYSVGIVSHEEIDIINILQATIKASKIAANKLNFDYDNSIDLFLVDGNMKFNDNKFVSIIKGDSKSYSIAAASIVAKVTRDKIMAEYHQQYPEFNWIQNSGYGTVEHRNAISEHGPTPIHRKTFQPIKNYLT
jgi:ribonuclease HII